MTRRFERFLLRLIMALFALTEEKLPPCACPFCRRTREQFERKRRKPTIHQENA